MNQPIKVSIDAKKLRKELMKNGQYVNLVIWPNRDGTDQYGNTHYVAQDVTKEQREAGERGPIVGNAKVPGQTRQQPRPPARPAQRPAPTPDPDLDAEEDSDIPF